MAGASGTHAGRSDLGTLGYLLDRAVLYASLSDGIDPVILLVPGHVTSDCARPKATDEFLYIETALTGRATFEAAVASAERGVAKYSQAQKIPIFYSEGPSRGDLSIAKARPEGIYPMPMVPQLKIPWSDSNSVRQRLILKQARETRKVSCIKNSHWKVREILDNAGCRSKIPAIRNSSCSLGRLFCMNFSQLANTTPNYPQSNAMDKQCMHPRVQVVSRDEDAEFVECLECREIFESSEFRDMDIEAKIPTEEE